MTMVSPSPSSPASWSRAARPLTPVPVGERSTSPSAKMQTCLLWWRASAGGPVKMTP